MYMETFDVLPISACVNGLYLAMHGGISHRLTSMEAINAIDRKMEPPDETLLADLLWADPASDRKADEMEYTENKNRGISCVFGKKPLKKLLDRENLRAIVRGHEVKQEGYKFHTWEGEGTFPLVITIFSAPAYSNSDNDAAIMISDGDGLDIKTFSVRQDKPYALPEGQDALSLFQPRLQGLVLDAVYNILKFTLGTQSQGLRRTLTKTKEIDTDYLETVIAASKEQEDPNAVAPEPSPRPDLEKMSMDELLNFYEKKQGVSAAS